MRIMQIHIPQFDCAEGIADRADAMKRAIEGRDNELNSDTILDYLAFCSGIAGAGNRLYLNQRGKAFKLTIDVKEITEIMPNNQDEPDFARGAG